MTWSDFYLICFVVGLLLSALSFVLGNLHLHIHLPFHFHFGHFDFGAPQAHGPAGAHGGGLPAINFGTITAFLAWFGGIGYLLTRHSNLYALTALGVAILGGFLGASIIFMAISRVLMRHEMQFEPEDCDMVGVLDDLAIPCSKAAPANWCMCTEEHATPVRPAAKTSRRSRKVPKWW